MLKLLVKGGTVTIRSSRVILMDVGATYQRLVDRAFQKQIGRNLEVYVDDLVIKSHTEEEIIRDIAETFKTLRQINMKLNPKKCTFEMQEGMFLIYKVNAEGLKVCPDKADAVLSLPSPGCLKDVQKLNGKLARSRSSLQTDEETHSGTPNADYTKGKGGANHVPSRGQESYQRSLNDRKGRQVIASILCEPCLTRARDQLHLHGKIGISLAQPSRRLKRFEATNNEAEYEALIAGLRIAEQMGVKNLHANVDSRLVANQEVLAIVEEEGQTWMTPIYEYLTKEILSEDKKKARVVRRKASRYTMINGTLYKKSFLGPLLRFGLPGEIVLDNGKQFRDNPFKDWSLGEGIKARLDERSKDWIEELSYVLWAHRTMIKSSNGETPFLLTYGTEAVIPAEIGMPTLRTAEVDPTKNDGALEINLDLIEEKREQAAIQEAKSKAKMKKYYNSKVRSTSFRLGDMVYMRNKRPPGHHSERTKDEWHVSQAKRCHEADNLRGFRLILCQFGLQLQITSPWPFYKWGIDIAGPFPEGPGKVKFLIVAIDYFTKWIEAKPVATITGNQVKKFIWDNIVCWFGLPGEIVTDKWKAYRDNPFKDWCEKLCIRQCFASVKHPQANGLVERANRSLGEGIKARLDERSKDWIGELSHVLWAHRTMIKSSNGETPFSLTYGTEAVIPAEIGMPTLRTAELDLTKNDEALGINLDLIEEKREQAAIQEAKSKAKMEKYYNSKVRSTSFRPGEMVYRSNDASHAKDGGKLGPKWEGPYEVAESLGKGAYKLKDKKGNELSRTWNICNLKKCYIHEV
ncbi:reverse transcriptase domain-containing protein [Tanacetum coccineum]